ncbi:MAG: prepilin-type N-terminal cleavage/methylation domain-containing protein [Elusimicrobiaceae bacterium]|nr:prepilin-type N-terminal cleavage/methylation domain-containing protein [Elusimicrobiaceae bacterium]
MKRAFTLIELLVVVLIIGILAAIALPQYQKAVLKSRSMQGLISLNALDKAQQEYRLANNTYTDDKENLSLSFSSSLSCGSTGETQKWCLIRISPNPKKAIFWFEWRGKLTDLTRRYACIAGNDDTPAQAVCQSIQRDWGGTEVKVHTDEGDEFTYYYGLWF